MNDERQIELETRLAYQEQAIAELNDVVTDQQAQLTRLESLLRSLAERLQAMAAAPAAGDADEKPPHY